MLAVTNLHDIPGWESDVGTYCLVVGYDDGGRTLKLNGTDTLDCPLDGGCLDLVFPGERQHEVSEREFLLACLRGLPHRLTLPAVGTKRFGAAAFRAWADDIDEGRFADDRLPLWENYGVYVCCLATSGGEPTYLYRKLAGLDPALRPLEPFGSRIQALLPAETPTGGRSLLWLELESLGGGMDMAQVRETMRDRARRGRVSETLRQYADRLEEALALMREAAALV